MRINAARELSCGVHRKVQTARRTTTKMKTKLTKKNTELGEVWRDPQALNEAIEADADELQFRKGEGRE